MKMSREDGGHRGFPDEDIAVAGPADLEAHEIDAAELARLDDFLSAALGEILPAKLVKESISKTHKGRLMSVADAAGQLMLIPFEVGPDGSGQVGEPLFHPRAEGLRDGLIRRAAVEIAAKGARTIYVALDPDDVLGQAFLGAGFSRGPLMLEMTGETPPSEAAPGEGRWVLYDASRRAQFAAVFYRTLEGSLDFPELPVSRDGAKLMETFEGRGGFSAEDFVVLEGAEGGGAILLLVELPERALEIAYMGVVPELRGRGVGRLLMARTFERARARGARRVSVTVDSRNIPAASLYRKSGLSEKRAVRVYFRAGKIF